MSDKQVVLEVMKLVGAEKAADVPAKVSALVIGHQLQPLVLTVAIDRASGRFMPVTNAGSEGQPAKDLAILVDAVQQVEMQLKQQLFALERAAVRKEETAEAR